jgi:hypothetical protein
VELSPSLPIDRSDKMRKLSRHSRSGSIRQQIAESAHLFM